MLLVIAHPDDEAMFFVPTVLALARDGRRVHLLCLSTGDFGGGAELGRVRAQELRESATRALGVIQADDVEVVDDEELRDGPLHQWNVEKIGRIVGEYVQARGVETIITFDEGGVSGHLNHIAVHHGVARYLALHSQQQKHIRKRSTINSSLPPASPPSSSSSSILTYRGSSACSDEAASSQSSTHPQRSSSEGDQVRGFKLETTSLARKYLGPLDVLWSMLVSEGVVFLTPLHLAFWPAHRCMLAHRSQYVWFRRLYVPFSRYSYVNSLLPITPSLAS